MNEQLPNLLNVVVQC